MANKGARVYGGWRALLAQARFGLSLLHKRVFHRREFRRLTLRASEGGLLESIRLLRRIGLGKVIRIGDQYQFSLLEPRWPSRAHDEMVAKGGLNVAAAGTPAKTQVGLAVLGITRRCPLRCAHCYERFNLGDVEVVPTSRWIQVIRELQEIGVGIVALSGGEPLAAYWRTREILEASDRGRSDFHLYTSGHGATSLRVRGLAHAGLAAVAVGLDDADPARHDAVRRRPGAFDDAVRAIRLFRDAGVLVYVNTCLSAELLRPGGLPAFYETLHALGVAAVQLLEPRACGGFADRGADPRFGSDERAAVRGFVAESLRARRYRSHPALYYPAMMEAPENLGCLGGGLSHFYVDSVGNVEPCVFLPVTFGNVLEESATAIFERMRAAVPRPLRQRCPSLQLAETVGFRPRPARPLPLRFDDVAEEWRRLHS